MFKHSITNDEESDDDIEKRVIDFGLTYEFGDVTWHPSQETVVYKKDFRVLITTEGDGVNDNPFFTPTDPAVAETNYALGNVYRSRWDKQSHLMSLEYMLSLD